MKKVLASGVVVLMVLFLSAGFGLANGPGSGGQSGGGAGDGTGPIHTITDGEAFEYLGDVISYVQGQGIEIATDSENIIIYGIGPMRYWDSLDPTVARPVVGDTITVSGYEVDYNGELRNIAVTIITVGGVEVPLRDSDGVPLWRGGGNGN